ESASSEDDLNAIISIRLSLSDENTEIFLVCDISPHNNAFRAGWSPNPSMRDSIEDLMFRSSNPSMRDKTVLREFESFNERHSNPSMRDRVQILPRETEFKSFHERQSDVWESKSFHERQSSNPSMRDNLMFRSSNPSMRD
ncbi:hypothetical protein L9F63_020561, partial [Diploptera punctata]